MTDNGIEEQVGRMVQEMEAARLNPPPIQDDGPQPVFDFSDLSYKESREFGLASADFIKAMLRNDSEAMEATMMRLKHCYAKVLVSVPREWLVKAAPDQIDWSDPESIDWLRATKAKQLNNAYNQQFAAAAKN